MTTVDHLVKAVEAGKVLTMEQIRTLVNSRSALERVRKLLK